jgi:GNAT superfamily N-acetyltransferase
MPGVEDRVIALPPKLTHRGLRPQDAEAVTSLIRACELADDGAAEIDRSDVEADFARAGFDPVTDGLLVLDGGAAVAWADVYKERAEADVHPAYRGRGIGAALLAWSESRARELGAAKVGQTVTDANVVAGRLFRANGYEPGHTAWQLEITFDDGPPPRAAPPDGVSIRPYDPDRDERAVYRLIEDAFNEWPERTPLAFEEWAPYVLWHGSFSGRLSRLAVDGDELVGAALCFDYPGDDEGWVHQLATRATHRHRGIARALLHAAFGAFYERGRRRCGLSTDSRTGALGLYERVGMSVRRSYTRYTKRLT